MQYFYGLKQIFNKYITSILLMLFIMTIYHNLFASTTESNINIANLSTSGSKQYSNGNFAAPKLTGERGKKYYTEEELSNPTNNPVTNDSKTYSSQSFTSKELTGQKGKKYYTKEEKANGPNKASVSSKSGSNQLFNYPQNSSNKDAVNQ